MRGKPQRTDLHRAGERNIPAYAGKTTSLAIPRRTSSEHPRVCGENPKGRTFTVPVNGTSPRMRGKQLHLRYRGALARNIPAYAGKTLFEAEAVRQPEEHPRVCGENEEGEEV